MMLSYYRVYERVCLCVFVLNRSTWKLSLVYFPNVMWVVVNNEINHSQNDQRDSQVDLPAWVFIYLTFITDEPRVTSFTGSRHIRISNQKMQAGRETVWVWTHAPYGKTTWISHVILSDNMQAHAKKMISCEINMTTQHLSVGENPDVKYSQWHLTLKGIIYIHSISHGPPSYFV